MDYASILAMVSMGKVKGMVFQLDPDSIPSRDGFSVVFYDHVGKLIKMICIMQC